jgi:oligopeptide transport system ATP-binding protein
MSEPAPKQNGSADVLLEARELTKHFGSARRLLQSPTPPVRAVEGVSFYIRRGETLALVGESGSGKSTTGRLLIKLLEPTAGDVLLEGESILKATPQAMRTLRRRLQIIFQDPYSSLNPRMTVAEIVGDPLAIHGIGTKRERIDRVRETLKAVELTAEHAERYPHEFSGGQRQRIGIARALVLEPDFIVCDEPISALDVSIQAQIINLLRRLQRERTLSYLFISHNLSVVRHIADRVAVMYLGRIVEIADTQDLYDNPRHPYTRALLSAVLEPDPDIRQPRLAMRGEPPSPRNPPSGCRFRLQCPMAQRLCEEREPELLAADGATSHSVACHFAATAQQKAEAPMLRSAT